MPALKKSILASQAFKEFASFGIEVTNKRQQLQVKAEIRNYFQSSHADSTAESWPFKRQTPDFIQQEMSNDESVSSELDDPNRSKSNSIYYFIMMKTCTKIFIMMTTCTEIVSLFFKCRVFSNQSPTSRFTVKETKSQQLVADCLSFTLN